MKKADVKQAEVAQTDIQATPKFSKNYLIGAASFFGTTCEAMAGALYNVTEEITQDEALKLLKDYVGKPVRPTKAEKGGK